MRAFARIAAPICSVTSKVRDRSRDTGLARVAECARPRHTSGMTDDVDSFSAAERTVLAQLTAYREQDQEAAERLLDDGLSFTSPQDDHIDKATFLERCFPTADRFERQEVSLLREIEPGLVVLRYIASLDDGTVFSNMELSRVVDGRITEIRVYFGGTDAFAE